MLSAMSRRQATKMSTAPSQTMESIDTQSIQEERVLCLKTASSLCFAEEQEQHLPALENFAGDKEQDTKVIRDKLSLEMPKDIKTKASIKEARDGVQTMEVQENAESNEPVGTTATESAPEKSREDRTDVEMTSTQGDFDHTASSAVTHTSSTSLPSPTTFNYTGKPMHGCTCGRIFETQRGRSMHWAHEPEHRRLWYERTKTATSPADGQQPSIGAEAVASAHSEPTSPHTHTSSPPHTPTSTPGSPIYDMSSFKTSARNPQYYSIIRTRRSSNVDSIVETGTKRARAVHDAMSGSSPPMKALHLDTGERVATAEAEKESPASQSPQKRKTSRELEPKGTMHRPRTRSLSSSDNVSPPVRSGGVTPEGNQKSSPITRSSAAAMKVHEFISLPTRRRRGGRRGRGGRGGGVIESTMESEEVYFPAQSSSKPPETDKKQKEVSEQPPPNPAQPVKRKRGRPPKNRPKEQTDSSSTGTTSNKSTPTLTSSHSAPSSARPGRPARGSSTKSEPATTKEESVEDPLPQTSDHGNSMKLPLWDTIRGEQVEDSNNKEKVSDAALCIPSILPKMYSKKESTASQPTPLSPNQLSSSQCSYVVTSKESSKGSETVLTTSVASERSSTRRSRRVSSEHDTEVSNKRKGHRRSSNIVTNKEEEPEVFEVADTTKSTVVDLTEESSNSSSTSQVHNTRKAKSKFRNSKSTTRSEKSASSSKDEENVEETKKEVEEEKALGEAVSTSEPTHRSSSVIVTAVSSTGKSQTKQEHQNTSSTSTANSSETKHTSENSEATQQPPQHRPVMNEPTILPYPPSSATTPTYPSYAYPGPYPPPPPIMFPGPPSSMYPPYYSYPGVTVTQPLPVPPPGHFLGMPHGMMPPPIPNTTEQQGLSSPRGNIPTPSFPQFSSPMPGGPVSTVMSGGATVSGVKVSVLDKPPIQMPTANVPHHSTAGSAAQQRPQYSMDAQNAAMGSLLRPYMAGAHSPDPPPGMDLSRQLHPHPLSQTYRPGMMGLSTAGYPPPPGPYPPHVTLRFDPSGMAYMDWVHETKPPPPEEQPAQPVECPECGRMFKNSKALNGHMRLHGGFDWTKKPFISLDNKHKEGTTASDASTSTHNGEEGSSDSDKKSTEKKLKKRSVSSANSRSRSKSPLSSDTTKSKKRRRSSDDTNPLVKEVKKETVSSSPLPVPRAPSVFTFDTKVEHKNISVSSSSMQDAGTMTQPATRNATLDDLCRAVEELERIENRGHKWKGGGEGNITHSRSSDVDEFGRKRPQDIIIPSHSSPAIERDRHRLGGTPPYTPPPILSPARSLTMIATVTQPGTPSRILHPWSSRRSSDGRKPSESDESYAEPRINVGKEFQAILPEYNESRAKASQDEYRATKVWQPIKDLTAEDDSVIDGYLELACSPASPYAGRNKELALHLLFQLGGSVKEAVRLLLNGKSVFSASHPMATYNYSGSKRWSAKERQQFRRAWRVHRKQFPLLRSAVETKTLQEVIEYYYSWKKYCSDEYRGRNRHLSEEILGSDEEDMVYQEIPSSSSSASADNDTPPIPNETSTKSDGDHEKLSKMQKEQKHNRMEKPPRLERHYNTYMELPSFAHAPRFAHPHLHPSSLTDRIYEHLPIVYAPHTAHPPQGQPVHQYKCKYPGCNQVFTSIFALNGHIRVHGGSFYPRPQAGSTGSGSHPNTSATSSSASTLHLQPTHVHVGTSTIPSMSHRPHSHTHKVNPGTDYRNQQQLELAKALLELPRPRSPARSGGYHTPSPKPSPIKSRSPATKKKVVGSSSSPGEREGYYPCNRCGRVFTKVKSRSAHMKSHIIKQH